MVAVSKSDIIIKAYTLNKPAADLIKYNGQLKMFNVISKASTNIGNLFIANAARGNDIQSVPLPGNKGFFKYLDGSFSFAHREGNLRISSQVLR